MNTFLTLGLAAVVASIAVTSMLFSVLWAQATPTAPDAMLAQAAIAAAR